MYECTTCTVYETLRLVRRSATIKGPQTNIIKVDLGTAVLKIYIIAVIEAYHLIIADPCLGYTERLNL
jgi:hypothetical protein